MLRPSLHGRLAAAAALVLATVSGGCLRFHLFQVDLPDDMQAQTTKNLGKLPVDRPPVSAAQPLTFAFVSDTHDGYDNWHKIVGELGKRPEVELVVHSGDFTDFGGQQEYIWFQREAALLTVPILVTTGNHDGLSNGPTLYERMFGPDNFAFSYRGVRFVFFNTNTLEWDLNEPDFTWLEQQRPAAPVAPATREPTILVTHHPPRSQPHLTPAVTVRYWSVINQFPIDLYLYGHIHDDFASTTITTTVQGTATATRFVKARTALQSAYSLITTDGSTYTVQNCVVGDPCVAGSFDGSADIPGVSAIDATTPPPDEYR